MPELVVDRDTPGRKRALVEDVAQRMRAEGAERDGAGTGERGGDEGSTSGPHGLGTARGWARPDVSARGSSVFRNTLDAIIFIRVRLGIRFREFPRTVRRIVRVCLGRVDSESSRFFHFQKYRAGRGIALIAAILAGDKFNQQVDK